MLTIRKFQSRLFTADELVRVGSMPPSILATLREAIVRRQDILISGGTGTGKTTMLNGLAVFIGNDDRIIGQRPPHTFQQLSQSRASGS